MERSKVPLFNDNPFKLGIFCLNVSHGTAATTAEGTLKGTWEQNTRIAQMVDRAGWEFLLPLGRWRGFGGRTNFNGRSFEVTTWAAGISAATSQIQVLATSHVPVVNPVFAAKQGTTVDHISGGRFALNVVAGWNDAEMRMFGITQREHDERYAMADEWLTVVKRCWTEEDEFDFEGQYFNLKSVYMMPKPLQKPYPVVVNAGMSPTGMRFGAKHADLSFQTGPDLETIKEKNIRLREIAWEEHRKEMGIIAHGLMICRETEKEAREYLEYCFIEHGDFEAMENLVGAQLAGDNRSTTPEEKRKWLNREIKGWGGYPLIGTPEQIVEEMQKLAGIGVNGIALHWVDYEEGITAVNERIIPLMVQAGLRKN